MRMLRKKGGRKDGQKSVCTFFLDQPIADGPRCPRCGVMMQDFEWDEKFVCPRCTEKLSYNLYDIYCYNMGITPDDPDGLDEAVLREIAHNV